MYGFQKVLECSISGRTNDLYAFSFILVDLIARFLLRFLLVIVTIIVVIIPAQLKFNVTPRHLEDVTCSITWFYSV